MNWMLICGDGSWEEVDRFETYEEAHSTMLEVIQEYLGIEFIFDSDGDIVNEGQNETWGEASDGSMWANNNLGDCNWSIVKLKSS